MYVSECVFVRQAGEFVGKCVCVCVYVLECCVHVWSIHFSTWDNTEKFSCHRHCDMISSSFYRLHYEAP